MTLGASPGLRLNCSQVLVRASKSLRARPFSAQEGAPPTRREPPHQASLSIPTCHTRKGTAKQPTRKGPRGQSNRRRRSQSTVLLSAQDVNLNNRVERKKCGLLNCTRTSAWSILFSCPATSRQLAISPRKSDLVHLSNRSISVHVEKPDSRQLALMSFVE